MIYDKITNICFYVGLSDDIRQGLEFLRDMSKDIENGVHEISPKVKAIVSEYMTKDVNKNEYEAHREYIDIQYLISGYEKICSLPLEYLKEKTPYNSDIDAAFLSENAIHPQELILGDGFFAIFFPQDGHMPQIRVEESVPVKKIVIKIKI